MESKPVLFVNVPLPLEEALRPILSRPGFTLEVVGASPAVADLVGQRAWRIVLVGLPIASPPLRDLLRAIRQIGSPARSASVLLAGPAGLAQAKPALETGANAFVEWPGSVDRAQTEIARFLDVAPRRHFRVLTKLRVVVSSGTRRIAVQSLDVSRSGMLLRMKDPFEIGTVVDLEFYLPNDPAVIAVTARVVRMARPGRETLEGIGLRFDSFRDPDAAERVIAFCNQR